MTMRFKSPDESDHVCQIRSLVASPVQGATEHWPKENRQLKLWSSTFLRPFAPRELPRFNATMNALTPEQSTLVALPAQVSLLYESNLPDVPTPTTPCRPRHREFAFHVSVQPRIAAFQPRLIPHGILYGTSASPLCSRLAAATGRIEFTFVSDHPFAFRCSPPRFTATQFRSATGSNSNLLTGPRTMLI
jgi:hypothetical protein